MRELLPSSKSKENVLNSVEEKPITREEFDNLLSALNKLKAQQDIYDEDLESFISDLKQSFETGTITTNTIQAVEGIIDDITSNSITTDEFKSSIAEITKLQSSEITTSSLNFDTATGNSIEVEEDVVAENIIAKDEVQAQTVRAENVVAEDFTIGQFNISKESVEKSDINKATIKNLDAEHIGATEVIADYVSTDTFDSNEVITVDNYSEHIYNKYLTHNHRPFNRQVIDNKATGADGDYWIVLPKFTNGHYYLIVKNGENGPFLWAMEISNDTKNISFTWSVNSSNQYLQDIEVIQDEEDELQFIQIHAQEHGKSSHLWFQCTSFETTKEPVIYGYKPYDGNKHQFTINREAGRWIPNSTFAGEFHAESLLIDDIEFDTVTVTHNIKLPTGYDQYGAPLNYTRGQKDQYITNVEDEFGNEGLKWVSPSEYPDEEDNRLISSKGVAAYTGETEQGNYPIKHLNKDTTVHGNLTIEDSLFANTHLFIGTEDEYNDATLEDDTFVIFTDGDNAGKLFRRRTFVKEGSQVVKLDELTVKNSDATLEHNKPIIYNKTRDALETSDELDIDTLRADNIIVEDLTVNGTAHINNQEEDTVVGNFLTLRANNNAGLATGEYSGMLVNNFKTGEVCALVVDSNGIARVGHATGTDTEYDDLYFKDDKYYTDEELTDEVEPKGVMLSWEDKIVLDDVIHWVKPVWTVLSFDSTQALLTREESEDLNDQGLLKWNADTYKADTLPVPTKNEQVLISHIEAATPDTPEQTTDVYSLSDRADEYYDEELQSITPPTDYDSTEGPSPVASYFRNRTDTTDDNLYCNFNSDTYQLYKRTSVTDTEEITGDAYSIAKIVGATIETTLVVNGNTYLGSDMDANNPNPAGKFLLQNATPSGVSEFEYLVLNTDDGHIYGFNYMGDNEWHRDITYSVITNADGQPIEISLYSGNAEPSVDYSSYTRITEWNATGYYSSYNDTEDQDITKTVYVKDAIPGQEAIFEYKWQDKQAGILRFKTMEEYETYEAENNVPTNSLIFIDEEPTYVYGDWQGDE